MDNQSRLFSELHRGGDPLILPNPWDAGTAKILVALGFKALATTSSGFAHSLGRPDGSITRDEALRHGEHIVAATTVPVSADLENCFADCPSDVSRTIQLALETGISGCSIEDYTGDNTQPLYEFGLAVERVEAAVETAHSIDPTFVVTARAENLLHGIDDLDETLRRLIAFEEVGADVLYAPGLSDIKTVELFTSTISAPLNVLAWGDFTVQSLKAAGVARISLGGRLARSSFSALIKGANQVLTEGSFDMPLELNPLGDLNKLFGNKSSIPEAK